jgi:glucosamine--fructose-6-phosphate aminotransferase (isomerizing)
MARNKKKITKAEEFTLTESLLELPSSILSVLDNSEKIKLAVKNFVNAKSALFLGRGSSFPIAMEGALKLKEISYIHAEGYASGEMKHGPIALVDDKVPVVVIAPKDFLFKKNISNMQEIMARGGKVLLITDKNGDKSTKEIQIDKIILPNVNEFVQPILYSIPVQLIAYFVAVRKGTDVDQPRNLAKSVTVE